MTSFVVCHCFVLWEVASRASNDATSHGNSLLQFKQTTTRSLTRSPSFLGAACIFVLIFPISSSSSNAYLKNDQHIKW